MTQTIVSLIGQQPIPNLLPIRAVRPDAALLIYTDFTEPAYRRLHDLVENDGVTPWPLAVPPYDIHEAVRRLRKEVMDRELKPEQMIFNITGGTKMMSLAAYLVAAELNAPFIYLQSQGSQTRLYHYTFHKGQPVLDSDTMLPPLIEAGDYLRAYVGDYKVTGYAKNDSRGRAFEEAIHAVLKPAVDEILTGVQMLGVVDIDFLVRCDNQVGIIEAKVGTNGIKKGLDQLNTAGGQQYLGTYTQKVFVCDQLWEQRLTDLKDLADARHITVVALPSYGQTGYISDEDAERLRQVIQRKLGRRQ